MALHVFGHVETKQFDAQTVGQLLGDLGLADSGRAAEEEGADRLAGIAEAGTGHLDRLGQRINRLFLTEDGGLQVAVEVLQRAAVVQRHMLRRNAGDLGDNLLDVGLADDFFLFRFRQNPLRCPRLVDDVDRLVGQVAVGDVAGGQFGGGRNCRRRILDSVVRFETCLQALEDLDGLGDRRFIDIDLLEAA